MRIAVDGMGGDRAPAVVVEGAVLAAQEFGAEIALVGDRARIEVELARHRHIPPNISVVHSSEVVGMDEPATTSVRKKKDSSISVAVGLVKERKADAVVSAGNTGAAVCSATLTLGLLEGIERPGIAIIYPTLSGVGMLIDAGANIDPKPSHLLQYAIMSDVYSRDILHKASPRLGLLNVGEEETKGPDFVKETHRLLNESHLNFLGNAEGGDIFSGKFDVIVCDGFVGNVVLKVSEGLGEALAEFLKRELTANLSRKLAAALSVPAFKALKRKIDYAEYGGAPLLGVNGDCIICHGSSNAVAIKNAIRVAAEFISLGVNDHIRAALVNLRIGRC